MEVILGQVSSFDDSAGFGQVAATNGQEWFFHCTAIADGSRTISEAQPVSFRVVPGRVGVWEAAEVQPLTP